MALEEREKRFLLLQINDALFPIGAYAHSYGLETYIQKGLIRNAEEAEEYIRAKTLYGLCHNELLAVGLAYKAAKDGDLPKILELEEIMGASRTPKETREAGNKLGSRFIKTVAPLGIPYESQIFEDYVSRRRGESVLHPIAYGVFCASVGIGFEEALEAYLYSQTSSMVTNCVKTVPLSQTDGQRLLFECQKTFKEALAMLEELGEEDLGLSTPGFDVRGMQHEGLYSRIYMS